MAAAGVLAVAREAEPADVAGGELATRTALSSDDGLSPGDVVAITADADGREETRGTVVRLSAEKIASRREDPTLGEIAIHFRRARYRIVKQ
ncbi:hypothetical protein WMF11_13225 [Sorangium sp. So ce295]|uniref:hypothetical protein n=1 Tax=Sorangium sp. So ce295 TaxID=3133295 RepID=UPI003F63BD97